VDNYSAVVLVGQLAGRIIKVAPGVTLEFRPSGTLNVLDLLDRGELDFAIGSFPELANDFPACRCCKMVSSPYCARITPQQAPASCRLKNRRAIAPCDFISSLCTTSLTRLLPAGD